MKSAAEAALALLVLSGALLRCRAALSLAGPYKLVLREFTACAEEGARTLRFEMRPCVTAAGARAFAGNVTLPQDLGSSVKGRVDISEWGAAGWAANAYSLDSRNMCKDLRRLAPGYFRSFTAALKVPASCPIARGRYSVSDWQVGLSVPFPVLPYGRYRVDVVYSNATTRLGCVRWVLDCQKR